MKKKPDRIKGKFAPGHSLIPGIYRKPHYTKVLQKMLKKSGDNPIIKYSRFEKKRGEH